MTKQSKYALAKALTGKAIFTILLIASISGTKAQSIQKEAAMNISINYLGSEDDMFVFGVRYYNTNGNKVLFQVKEDNGNTLFREVYTDKIFGKKFKIPKDLEGKIYFVIRNLATNSVETFEANSNVRFSEDMVVTKLK